jgi:hypothetical protein
MHGVRFDAILRPEDYDLWLDPGVTVPSRVIGCLPPFDAKLMKKYPVSTRVNRPENDDPACAQEIPLPNAPKCCSENSLGQWDQEMWRLLILRVGARAWRRTKILCDQEIS